MIMTLLNKPTHGSSSLSGGGNLVENKDTNRTKIIMRTSGSGSSTATTYLNFQTVVGSVPNTTGISYTVSDNKKLRIQAVNFNVIPTASTPVNSIISTTFRILENNTTDYAITINWNKGMDAFPFQMSIPDGLEYSSGTVLRINQISSSATMLEEFSMIGYEY